MKSVSFNSSNLFFQIQTKSKEISSYVKKGCKITLKAADLIKKDTGQLSGVLKGAQKTITLFRPELVSSKLFSEIKKVLLFLSGISFLADIEYFVNGHYKKDNDLQVAGNVFFSISNLLSIGIFLEKIALIKLGTFSASFGAISVLGTVVQFSLNSLLSHVLGMGIFLSGLGTLTRLIEGSDSTQALIDLLKWGLEVTAFCLAFFNVASLSVILAISIVSALVGLTSFLYSKREELKAL